ncbi:MAG: lipocalin family protein [Reichenbachiella sp.]
MNKELKYSLLPVVALPMLFVSCESEEDDPSGGSNEDLLLGEWSLVSVDGDSYESYNITMNFKADGDMIWCGDYEENGTIINECDTYEWELVGSTITYGEAGTVGDDYKIDIISISADELIGDHYDDDSLEGGDKYRIVLEK